MGRGHSGEKIESEDKVKGCRMVKVKADKYYQIERLIEREDRESEKKTIEFGDKMGGRQMVLLKADKYPYIDKQIE